VSTHTLRQALFSNRIWVNQFKDTDFLSSCVSEENLRAIWCRFLPAHEWLWW